MRRSFSAVLLCAAVFPACAEPATTNPTALMTPEPRHTFSQQERDSLRPGINVDALERLLGRLPPEERGRVMPYFRRGVRAGVVASSDPEEDALIREVWGPSPVPPGMHERPSGPPRPVALALAPELLPSDVGAVVLRQSGGRDVIVLPEAHATLEQLWTARGALESDRRRNGWAVTADRSFVVPVARPVPPGAHYERTTAMLEREHRGELSAVHRAPVEEVAGVGPVRLVRIEPGGPRRP